MVNEDGKQLRDTLPCRASPTDRSRSIPGKVGSFEGRDIAEVACGDNHMAAIESVKGQLFTFGKAQTGRCPLGHGDSLGATADQQSWVGDTHAPRPVAVPRRDCLGTCFKGYAHVDATGAAARV